MPSLTLLAADPHLTPVRARPSLLFAGRGGRRMLRDGRGGRAGMMRAVSRRHREAPASADRPARQRTRLSLRSRGERPPRPRRAAFSRWRLAIAATLVLLIVAGLGVLRVWPPFAVVMSGSMAPTINTGDMVVLERLRAPARVGDVVAVPVPDDARTRYGYPPVVIHRVLRITNGQIRTKGDARPAADPFTVPRVAVDAKVIAHIPAGGRILSFLDSAPGLVWLLFGGALLCGLPLLDRLRDARGRDATATAGLREELAGVMSELARLQEEQQRSRRAADDMLARIDRLARLVEEALAADRPAAATAPPAEAPGADGAQPGAGATSPGLLAEATAADSGQTRGSKLCAEPLPEAIANAEAAVPVPEPASADHAPTPVLEQSPAAQLALSMDVPAGAPVVVPPVAGKPATASALATRPGLAGPDGEPARPRLIAASPAAGAVLAAHARVVAGARWDAPPPAGARSDGGWAAPPASVRSSRFQRPGRLVAASLMHPSPAP
jgi:signal peptidase I